MEKVNVICKGTARINKAGPPHIKAEIEWTLAQGQHGPAFTANGSVYVGRSASHGQCLEDLTGHLSAENEHEAKVLRIIEVWRKYHMNDSRMGTPEQEKAIEGYHADCKRLNKRFDYDEACDYLRERHLYEVSVLGCKCLGEFPSAVTLGHRGYRYGERWVYSAIPSSIIEEIKAWETEV